MRNKFYILTAVILVLDYLTKWLVRTSMIHERAIELIPGYLRLAYVGNTGVAFGLFQGLQPWKPYALAALAVVAVTVILVYSARTPASRRLLQCALALTMGGILGNFIDRLARGYVVDFIEFHIRDAFYWPTFNVADSAISIGIALLLIDIIKNPELGREPQGP